MDAKTPLTFDGGDTGSRLDGLTKEELDRLDFGVIGFDQETLVQRYNAFEVQYAGLATEQVIGQLLFDEVAVCMNNFLVAQRFEDALAQGHALDAVIDYVLTLRMRPTRVKLRLIARPGSAMRYVLVNRMT